MNFRLWGASLQRLEYIIRVIFYTEWIEGEVSFTYSPIKLWWTLTLRRSSGNDWSGCILQIAFALFNSPLHWSVSCTFLCSRRLHFCLKKPQTWQVSINLRYKTSRSSDEQALHLNTYISGPQLRGTFSAVILQFVLLCRQPHRLQRQMHLLHRQLGSQLKVMQTGE